MTFSLPKYREEIIGDCRLILADCMDVLPTLGKVDAIIVDPPYSARCHAGHDSGAAKSRDGSDRSALGYASLSRDDCAELAGLFTSVCNGWIVWMTDSDLALHIRTTLETFGRYAFAPLPFYQPGRSVRLSGDGPSSWTDWICVARTKQQMKWRTLPEGYMAGEGWNDKARMGGKPTLLMDALVRDYSNAGDTVLDSHMGAGTTGVSCIKLGRKFIGIEIDPEAFDIACKRIREAYAQPDMFIEQEKPMKQDVLSWM